MKKRLLSTFMAAVISILSAGAVNVSAATTTTMNVINITQSLDSASELTWLASANVKVSEADNIGGRYNVLKVEGLANSNNNTAGLKLPDGFAFKEGDILTYRLDVYSETSINPDIWLRNHNSTLAPFAQFSHESITTNTWRTVTKTVTYDEMVKISVGGGSTGNFDTAGNYAIYIRPRSSATVYLDNFTVTVSREVGRGNIINIDTPLDSASELTWIASDAVTVSNTNGVGGRDKVLKVEGLANSNNNTAGLRFPDGFTFKEGDILTYSLDVYPNSAINPDIWVRNHNSSLAPFVTLFQESIPANTWTTITKKTTYEEMVQQSLAAGSTGNFSASGNYAIYIRPRSNATVYLDNLKVTVSRLGYEEPAPAPTPTPEAHQHTYGEWKTDGATNHKKTCSLCGDIVRKAHTWNVGVITTEPTYTSTGIKTYTCTGCGQTKTEAVDKLVSPSERTTITVGSVTTCAENGITVPVSISKNAGLMGLTLQIKYDSDVLALTGATKGTALRNLAFTRGAMNENPATFIWDGSSEDTSNGQILLLTFAIVDTTASEYTVEAIVKSACDDKLNTVQTNATAGNITKKSHSYSSWMKNDNDTHKKVCDCGKEITEIHNWNAGTITIPATHTKDGEKTYTCATCGETKTEVIEKDAESHTYESYVADGAKNHKKLCSCGAFAIEAHKWDAGVVITQPTAGTAGVKRYTCTVCKYTKTETSGSRLPTENDTNLTVGNITARSGDEITVTVSISKNVGITGLQLTFGYNTDALTLTKVTKGTALGSMEFTEPGDFNEERLVFVWDGQDADSSNGEILLLNFKVADTAVAGDYQIFVNLEIACDQNFNSVPIYLKNGTVKIANQLPGDINNDKTVDIKDVMLTRRYVAGGYGVTLNESIADVNKDGSVDIKDVMLMRRYVAGGYGVVLK